jgi:hypothetical protein
MNAEILSRIVENFIDAKRATKGFDLQSATAIRKTDLDGFYALESLGKQDRRCDAQGSDRARRAAVENNLRHPLGDEITDVSASPHLSGVFGATSAASFWKRGSFRSGSNIGSSRRSAGVSGGICPKSFRSIVSARAT